MGEGNGDPDVRTIDGRTIRRGLPFRSAHHVVGTLVASTEAAGQTLNAVGDEAITAALRSSDDPDTAALATEPGIADAIRAAASIDGALASCDVVGGTAPRRVAAELAAVRARLEML